MMFSMHLATILTTVSINYIYIYLMSHSLNVPIKNCRAMIPIQAMEFQEPILIPLGDTYHYLSRWMKGHTQAAQLSIS